MGLTNASQKNIINVVEQFDYSTQCDKYNQSFIKWRKNKDNPFAFNFKQNRKESVFVDGKGFESKSLSAAEHETITRIMNITGIAMLIWVVIDKILSKVFISIFDLLGFNLHASFFSTGIYGGTVGIVTALIVIDIFKIIVPAFYIHKHLKMPIRVEFMTKLRHFSDLLGSIFMSMAVSAVTSLPNIYTNRTRMVFNYFRDLNTDSSVWNQDQFVIYSVFDIIVVSILTELFFRGAVFGALRQFGDIFAIIITSVMSALLAQDFRELPAALLMSAVAAFGMLRSGTILTAIFVQIIFKMYRLALVLFEANSPDTIFLKRNTFILAVFIIGAAGFILIYLIGKRKNQHHISDYKSDTTLKQRLMIAARSFPVPAVAMICLMAALIKLIF